MLTFAIPLMPRCRARSWELVVENFNRTVASLLAQTDPDFQILVGCQDRPRLEAPDPRIRFVYVAAVDTDREQDKRRRIRGMAAKLHEDGGGVLMPVDADDLLNRRVAAYVNAHPEADTFVASTGWELDMRTRRMRLAPRFWNLCGSAMAMRLAPEDLPATAEADGGLLDAGHQDFPSLCAERGMRQLAFPFLASVYRIHTGENSSLKHDFQHGWKRALYRRVIPSLSVTRRVRRDYQLQDRPLPTPLASHEVAAAA